MALDKLEYDRIYEAGYKKGWSSRSKDDQTSENPYRDAGDDREVTWDLGFTAGERDKAMDEAGRLPNQPID